MIKSMENLLRSNVINLIMKEVSLLVTYGTSVNTGHNHGSWKIFQYYRLENFSEPVSPILTIWKAASNKIPEIKNMLMTLSGISSHFAKSEVRCRE